MLFGINDAVERLLNHHELSTRCINLTPSENVLSPLARLPFVLDAHSRYFLDDLRLFGDWSFPSGEKLGDIEQNILIPSLKKLAKAEYVNVRPISGINCMTIALAALSEVGDTIYSVPVSSGGHPSTAYVAKRLGLSSKEIPFSNAFDIDYDALEKSLLKDNPAILYIDQATFLFPIDPKPIRKIIDNYNLKTIIHYDSSHLNGFIFGGVTDNPLTAGAHCYGGSTHKTFPGPHKGFLATNEFHLHEKILECSDHFVSHHHMASTISFAISLLEFLYCGGVQYIEQVVTNNTAFINALDSSKQYKIITHNKEHTKTHQIWLTLNNPEKAREVELMLRQSGIILNCFNALPGTCNPAYRMSLSEFTRFGAEEEDAIILANCFERISEIGSVTDEIKKEVLNLKNKNKDIKYCYATKDIHTDFLNRVVKDIFING